MARQRSIIIVPAAQQGQANAAAKEIDKVGGERTFTVPLRRQTDLDTAPPSHYICNWQLEGNERAELEAAFRLTGVWATTKINDLVSPDPADIRNTTLETVLQREGLKRETPDIARTLVSR